MTWSCLFCKLLIKDAIPCKGCGHVPLPNEVYETQWSYDMPVGFLHEGGPIFILMTLARKCKKTFLAFKDAVFGYILKHLNLLLKLLQHLLNLLIFRENADFVDAEVQATMLDLFDGFVAAKLERNNKQCFTITATPQNLRFQLDPKEDIQADIFFAILAAKDGEVQPYMHNNFQMRSFICILMYTVGSKSCGFEAQHRRY